MMSKTVPAGQTVEQYIRPKIRAVISHSPIHMRLHAAMASTICRRLRKHDEPVATAIVIAAQTATASRVRPYLSLRYNFISYKYTPK